MKNKKGFTLIELLGVIVLITVILALAMVALSGISKKRKEQAWGEVKNEIEAAAKEYFSSNEYYYENINGGIINSKIYVGNLVKQDYLNKLIDPRYNTSVDQCSYVEVNYDNGKYTAEYKEEIDESCMLDTVTLSEVSTMEPPKVDFDISCSYKSDKNNYYNDDQDEKNWCYEFKISPKNKGENITTKYSIDDSDNWIKTDEYIDEMEKQIDKLDSNKKSIYENYKKVVNIQVTDDNTNVKKVIYNFATYAIDRTAPNITNLTFSSNNDNEGIFNLKAKLSDEKSGVNHVTFGGDEINLGTDSEQSDDVVVFNNYEMNEEINANECINGKQTITTTTYKVDKDGNKLQACPPDIKTESVSCDGSQPNPTPVTPKTVLSCGDVVIKSGSKGNKNWYKSQVTLTINPKGATKWTWYVTDINKNGTASKNYAQGNTYKTSHDVTIKADGIGRRGKYIIYDSNGNKKTCYTQKFNIDKTPPTMTISYGPKKESCGGSKSIHTEYVVKDSISGLLLVEDYYGYDSSIPNINDVNWRKRNIKAGQKSYRHDHNWGPYCSSRGTPGKGTCYKLKYYLIDVAGNVTKGYTNKCATY